MPHSTHIILSASRLCDLPAFYPHYLIQRVLQYQQSGKNIHTLVLWTKHPLSLLSNPLYDFLNSLKLQGIQLFVHLSITGMGAMPDLEPNVPDYKISLQLLPDIIRLVSSPERITLRIDPLVHLRMRDGRIYSNLELLPIIIENASESGIKNFVFSLLKAGIYSKVDRRFGKTGIRILPFSDEMLQNLKKYTLDLKSQGIGLQACCVQGFDETACIDGHSLMTMHDSIHPLLVKQMRHRPMCGCTQSTDIGGWPPKMCNSGCLYCYARPAL
ncbi:MAG: DUF1848 family protein [Bacteroidales bacterium]|nr:DUF1848 family protein [Bacteroidales bacterium]